MNVLLFISAQSSVAAAGLAQKLVGNALSSFEDAEDIAANMSLGIAMSMDEHGGWSLLDGIAEPQDVIVFFGKTAQSAGLGDLPSYTVRKVLLDNHPLPVKVVKLPSLLSSTWADLATQDSAFDALRDVLRSDKLPPTAVVRGDNLWN